MLHFLLPASRAPAARAMHPQKKKRSPESDDMEIDSEDGRNSEVVIDVAPTELDKPASPTEVTDTAGSPGELADTDSEQGELPAWAQSVEGGRATVPPPPTAAAAAADAVVHAEGVPAATRPATTAATAALEEPVAGKGAHAAAPHPTPAEAPAAAEVGAPQRPSAAAKNGQADVLAAPGAPAETAKAAVPVDPVVTGEGSNAAAASPQGATPPAASTAPAAAAPQPASVQSTPGQAAAAAPASPEQPQTAAEESPSQPGTSKEGSVAGQSDFAQSRAAAVPTHKQADKAPAASGPQSASPEAFISFEGLGEATAEAGAARQPGAPGAAEPMELDEGLPAPGAGGSSMLHFMPLGEHAPEPPTQAQPPPPDLDAQTPQGGSVALTAAACAAVSQLRPATLICVMPLQHPARRRHCTAHLVHPAAPYLEAAFASP